MSLFGRRRQKEDTPHQQPEPQTRSLTALVGRARLLVGTELESRRRGKELADLLNVTAASEWFDPEMREIRRQLDLKIRQNNFKLSALSINDLRRLTEVIEAIDRAARRQTGLK
jgi:hypothetical protein